MRRSASRSGPPASFLPLNFEFGSSYRTLYSSIVSESHVASYRDLVARVVEFVVGLRGKYRCMRPAHGPASHDISLASGRSMSDEGFGGIGVYKMKAQRRFALPRYFESMFRIWYVQRSSSVSGVSMQRQYSHPRRPLNDFRPLRRKDIHGSVG